MVNRATVLLVLVLMAATTQCATMKLKQLKPIGKTQQKPAHFGALKDAAKDGVTDAVKDITVQAGVEIINKTFDAYHGQILKHIKTGFEMLSTAGVAFENKARPLVLAVINDSKRNLKLAEINNDSGKVFAHPPVGQILIPGQIHIFYLANKDTSFFTGVSGWINYSENGRQSLGIGFSHPFTGSVKTKASFSKDGEAMYDEMKNTAHPGIMRKDLSGVPEINVILSLV